MIALVLMAVFQISGAAITNRMTDLRLSGYQLNLFNFSLRLSILTMGWKYVFRSGGRLYEPRQRVHIFNHPVELHLLHEHHITGPARYFQITSATVLVLQLFDN